MPSHADPVKQLMWLLASLYAHAASTGCLSLAVVKNIFLLQAERVRGSGDSFQ